MYTQRTCVLLRFLRGVSTLGQHLGCLFVGLYIHSSLEDQTNIYIRGYFQTSTVSEWIYYFLRLNVHTQKNGTISVLKNSEYFNFVPVDMTLFHIFIDLFSVWSVLTILRFNNNNKVPYEVKNVLTSVLHHSVKEEMTSSTLIWRLKAPSHSGSYSRCIPVCLLTSSIPY